MASKKITKNGNGNDLLKELWNAAVNLRGNIEPSDYKRYVLPLIFLRFLSLKYEKRREELEKLTKDPNSNYYSDDPEIISDILEDEDEYTKVGALILPEDVRWENIIKIGQADDIKKKLDDILEKLENTYPKLKGLLPKIYSGSNLDKDNIGGLINLFSKDIFKQDHGGVDLIGKVYEYFIGEFASSEGKRGGEYFTPQSIVKLLVAMLDPSEGTVFDPCCGSGGMFVQADEFTKHNGQLSFCGQESKDFTYRLCKLNMFIHGIDGNIALGNSYFNDKHSNLKFDYIIANPPFNDGSKSEKGWGADKVNNEDIRLQIGKSKVGLAAKNANYMWIMHFLSHLNNKGTAGFVMANGSMSTASSEELAARKALIENGFVDCIVQLPDKLFANTGIPCCLWFLSRNRSENTLYRKRPKDVLFIYAKNFGTLIEGSRSQKELSEKSEINKIAKTYHNWRSKDYNVKYENIVGFCKSATFEEIEKNNFILTPGRYVGIEEKEDDNEPYEEKMERLTNLLSEQFKQSNDLDERIKQNLVRIGYEF